MKSFFDVVKKIFTILVTVASVAIMIFTIVSVLTFNRNDRNIFGFKAFIVLSDSMKATDFASGDVVIVKNVDPTTLAEGDIIAYTSQNPDSFGETITHKIRRLTTDGNGDKGFVTYGTTTNVDDEIIVTYPYVNGKYVLSLPKVGVFFNFLKTTPGFIMCILVPFFLLIGIQGLNTIKLFRKYRREQMEVLEEERTKLEEERSQSEAMMRELMQLKAQMAATVTSAGAQEVPAAEAPVEGVTEAPVSEAPVEEVAEAPVEGVAEAPVSEAPEEGVAEAPAAETVDEAVTAPESADTEQ